MPIDIYSAFSKVTNHVANKSIIGKVIGNPVWLAVIICVVILLMFYYWDLISGIEFRHIFYTLLVTVGLVMAHDFIIVAQAKESLESSDSEKIMDEPIASPDQLIPRRNVTLDSLESVNSIDDIIKS